MKLKNDIELENTRRKLRDLEQLIQKREEFPDGSPAHEVSLKTMKRFADKLRAEIVEYEKQHHEAASR